MNSKFHLCLKVHLHHFPSLEQFSPIEIPLYDLHVIIMMLQKIGREEKERGGERGGKREREEREERERERSLPLSAKRASKSVNSGQRAVAKVDIPSS
jgi:hypothetical protein